MLWFLLSLPVVLAEFPNDPCWTEGEACKVEAGNLLNSSTSGVPDLPTCRQLCEETDGCEFLSHFGPESFPLQEHCMLFSSCKSLIVCEDCRTEAKFCVGTCGESVEGTIGGNHIDTIAAVHSELDCKSNCSVNNQCKGRIRLIFKRQNICSSIHEWRVKFILTFPNEN